ncbi:RdgB/HAM1 family non-canonical purine NTP pyrophosphatase [Alicyclobacillus kakegawensis]|uniref:RdgB/HAM1 family non-canonical purine NTP pyrophosphatase n=1 Tax=Alicyclobacillus kakegawensis TaxID=392012 RepID=UPI00082DDFB6|nr:RdgB/HAM1 family non-canonical purine NTP pyrophosphatase [Alicyclobacillus kakegawensis]
METVFVVTKNAHKVAEFERLLAPLGACVRGLPDGLEAAPETGAQLVSNAVEKAAYYAPYCHGWVLADDSGLCVDALDGRPGVMSARYAGVHGDDAANNAKLLRELADVPDPQRTAEFVCALALWHHELGVGLTAVGRVRGIILRAPHGANGFGYDPLFWVPELGRTFADMTVEEKNQYSHRRRAVDRLLELAAHIPLVS